AWEAPPDDAALRIEQGCRAAVADHAEIERGLLRCVGRHLPFPLDFGSELEVVSPGFPAAMPEGVGRQSHGGKSKAQRAKIIKTAPKTPAKRHCLERSGTCPPKAPLNDSPPSRRQASGLNFVRSP